MDTHHNNEAAIRWMQEAGAMAGRALCHRKKCGAVVVVGGEIIGRGYNAPPLDDEANRLCDESLDTVKPKYDRTCCVHAEWRAIMDALRNAPEKIVGSKLYFARVEGGEIRRSGRPFCTVCSRLALDVGVAAFALWHDDGVREYPTGEYNRLSYRFLQPEKTH